MNDAFAESAVEEAALAWLERSGWRVAHGHDIAPDLAAGERRDVCYDALADAHMPQLHEARK
jgi:hypothetical protein